MDNTFEMSLASIGQDFTDGVVFQLSAAKNLLRDVEAGTFSSNAKVSPDDPVVLDFPKTSYPSSELKHRIITNAYCCIIRELVQLLNIRLSMAEVESDVNNGTINLIKSFNEADMKALLDAKVIEIAKQRIEFAEKLRRLPHLDKTLVECAINFNKIRNSIEHHRSIAKENVELIVFTPTFIVNGKSVSFPAETQTGDLVEVSIRKVHRNIKHSEKVSLTESELTQVCYTLIRHLGEDILS